MFWDTNFRPDSVLRSAPSDSLSPRAAGGGEASGEKALPKGNQRVEGERPGGKTPFRGDNNNPDTFFDILWASPPCTEYSPAKAGSKRDLDTADAIVKAVITIIQLAQPRVWFIENPHTMLYTRAFMQALEEYRIRCTYCKYGFGYKKDTDIWTNLKSVHLQHCDIFPCSHVREKGVHPSTAQRGPSGPFNTPGIPSAQAGSVPRKLLNILIKAATRFIVETMDKSHVATRSA